MAKKTNKKNEKIKNTEKLGLGSELKKVTWPKAEVLLKSTGAVVFLVLVVALIIFVSDMAFSTSSKKFSEFVVSKKGTNVVQTSNHSNKNKKEEKKEDSTKQEENKKEEQNKQ